MQAEVKREFLKLLHELVRDSFHTHTDSNDWSGCSTTYLVDQERLLRNIEKELERL